MPISGPHEHELKGIVLVAGIYDLSCVDTHVHIGMVCGTILNPLAGTGGGRRLCAA